jgi:hypothetical protein
MVRWASPCIVRGLHRETGMATISGLDFPLSAARRELARRVVRFQL